MTIESSDGMLETIREYAQERLTQSGEVEDVSRRHAAYFAELAGQAEAQLAGPNQGGWLTCLEAEHDNLRAALEWSQSEQGDQDLGLRLAGSLWRFWYVRGHLREGTSWLEVMLARAEERVTAQRSKALRGAGAMLYAQGKHAVSAAYLERALAMYRELGDREGEGACLNNLAVWRDELGDTDGARELHERALSLRRETGDSVGIATAIGNLGALAHDQRDLGRARALYEERLAIEQELGNVDGMAITLANLGELVRQQGDWKGAVPYLREGLILGARLGDRDVVANCLDGLGYVAVHLGNFGCAARLHGAARAARDGTGSPVRPSHRSDYEAHIDEVRAALSPGEFDTHWGEGRTMPLDEAVALALALPFVPTQ